MIAFDFLNDPLDPISTFFGFIFVLIIIALAIALYLIPSVIAFVRRHPLGGHLKSGHTWSPENRPTD